MRNMRERDRSRRRNPNLDEYRKRAREDGDDTLSDEEADYVAEQSRALWPGDDGEHAPRG